MELPVGLCHTKVQITGADAVDVCHGTARRVRALDVVVLGATVDETADCAANLVINAGLSAGADRHELFRKCGARQTNGSQQSCAKSAIT